MGGILAMSKRSHSPGSQGAESTCVQSAPKRVPSEDGRGNAHKLRVVSLLPSATEVLALIGGGHLLVGRSHECDFPAELVKDVPMVTSSNLTFETSGQVDTEVRLRAAGCYKASKQRACAAARRSK